jgi:hypothetical protein
MINKFVLFMIESTLAAAHYHKLFDISIPMDLQRHLRDLKRLVLIFTAKSVFTLSWTWRSVRSPARSLHRSSSLKLRYLMFWPQYAALRD